MAFRTVFLAVSLIAAGICWYLYAILKTSGLHDRRMRGFGTLCIIVPFWMIITAFYSIIEPEYVTVVYIIKSIPNNIIPYLSCWFILNFTESKAARSRFIRYFSIAMPALAFIMLSTNALHGLYILSYGNPPSTGPLFIAHLMLTICYMIAVYITLFRYIIKNLIKNPLLAVSGIGTMIPIIIYAVYLFVPDTLPVDLTPIGYFFTIIFIAYASYYTRLRKAKPGMLGDTLAAIAGAQEISKGSIYPAARLIAKEGCNALHTYRVRVWNFDMQSHTIKCIASYNSIFGGYAAQEDINLQGVEGFDDYLANERIIVIDSAREAAVASGLENPYDPEVCAVLMAPVRIDRIPVGLVCVEQDYCENYPSRRDWDTEEQSFVSSLADLMAIAITNADRQKLMQQLEGEVNEYTGLMRLLHKMSETLLQARLDDFDASLNWCANTLAAAIAINRVRVWKNTVRDGQMYCSEVFTWTDDSESQVSNKNAVEISYDEVIPGWWDVLSNGICINGTADEMSDTVQERLRPQGIQSILVVPIFLQNRFWGFTGFYDCRNERQFTGKEEIILRSASDLIAIVLSRNEEAEKAYYDALTGVYNRRYLDEHLERLIKSLSRRPGSMLSLMMIDIDRFKQYNDAYGHDTGDICLKSVAEVLSGCISRKDDFVARYGGEEFAVVLPNTDEAGARKLAEHLLDSIRNRKLPHKSSDIVDYVTFSVGVVTGIADFRQNGTDYIKCADIMLYKSKQEGRNRYSFSQM